MPMRIPAAILAACLLAAACHPHEIASHATADRAPVVLNGMTMSSIAADNRAEPSERMVGAAAGTFLSAFITPDVAVILAPSDRPHLERALIQAHSGHSSAWMNPDTGHYGNVTPTGMGTTADGLPCRKIRQMVSASGQRAWVQGQACQHQDGTWSRVAP